MSQARSPSCDFHFIVDETDRTLILFHQEHHAVEKAPSPTPAVLRTIYPPINRKASGLHQTLSWRPIISMVSLVLALLPVFILIDEESKSPNEVSKKRFLLFLSLVLCITTMLCCCAASISRPSSVRPSLSSGQLILLRQDGLLLIESRAIPVSAIRHFRCVTRQRFISQGRGRYVLCIDYGIELVSLALPLVYGFVGDEKACLRVVDHLNTALEEIWGLNESCGPPPHVFPAYGHEELATPVTLLTPLPESAPCETKFGIPESAGEVIKFTRGLETIELRPDEIVHENSTALLSKASSRCLVREIDGVQLYMKKATTIYTLERRRTSGTDAIAGERFGVRLLSHGHPVVAMSNLSEGDALLLCSTLRQVYPQIFSNVQGA